MSTPKLASSRVGSKSANRDGPRRAPAPQQAEAGKGRKDRSTPVLDTNTAIAAIGIDIGKNSFHVVATMRAAHRAAAKVVRVAKWRCGLPIYRLV